MIRTVISLDPDDKRWLEQQARAEHVSMAELIRRAIASYRQQTPPDKEVLKELLEETSGIWTQGDGLQYQEELRKEWDTET